jgi:alpha-tubulin suppressor-like RCC1 family protein
VSPEEAFLGAQEDGTVVAWGNNLFKQCVIPEGLTGVKAICAESYNAAALTEDGKVVYGGL